MDICDYCELPVIQTADGNWRHAEVADEAFCMFVMAPARKDDDD